MVTMRFKIQVEYNLCWLKTVGKHFYVEIKIFKVLFMDLKVCILNLFWPL